MRIRSTTDLAHRAGRFTGRRLARPRVTAAVLVAVAAVVTVAALAGAHAGPARPATPSRVSPAATRSAAASGAGGGSVVESTAGLARGGAAGNGAASGTISAGGGSGGSGPALPALPPGATGQSARIEETGSLTLVVAGSAIEHDIAELGDLAFANGGFVASSATQSAGAGAPAQGSVTLQIPQPAFAAVLAQAQRYGKVGALSSRATDVTGQYVDLQARIAALGDSRQQYLAILSRASSIGDVLSVQSQLDALQTQIEQLQGQLQVLDDQTNYASLAVTLTQKVPPPVPVRPASGITAAWHGALSGFTAGLDGLVRLAGPLLFALIVVTAVVLAGRGAWHLGRRRLT